MYYFCDKFNLTNLIDEQAIFLNREIITGKLV